ncbi:MAG TPA: site-2 protease family protein [Acidobacteriota bacterium]|nr:site-2 protease family protein [Acidobacteriota bacterium]
MKWSIKLGRLAGIDVYMHLTFVLILGWVGWIYYNQTGTLEGVLNGLVLILAVFGIVVLHELGHALTARRYGIETRDITLLPIGGVARLEKMPEDPRQELVVALAGPAVNVVLAVIFIASVVGLWGTGRLQDVEMVTGSFLTQMAAINVMLAAFNMLPAFPMDGGRVLRALLALRMDYVKATQVAASIGQGMALLFGFLGLLWNPFLIFIALFVWLGASEESGMVQIKSAMSGLPISHAMITEFRTLEASDSLRQGVDHLLAGFQHDFPVVDRDGELIGVLTRSDLISALRNQGEETRVHDVMQTDFQVAEPNEMMETVFNRLRQCTCRSLPILKDGRLVGMVTMDNLGEFMSIQGAAKIVESDSMPSSS